MRRHPITPPQLSGKAIAKGWAESHTLASVDLRANRLDKEAIAKLLSAKNAAAKRRPTNATEPAVELLVDE